MEKVRKFFTDVKNSWKNIKFISRKTAIKRTIIVLVSMLVLGAIIMLVDYLVGNGFKALSLLSLNVNIAKIICTVIFSISALVLILFGVLIKSETKSFTAPSNNYFGTKKNSQYKMNKIMLISSIICFISAIGSYILQ